MTRRGGILRQRDFRHLWVADALSELGSRMSLLAVPLLALTVLSASPLQVALLTASERGATLLLGLLVGAWADRARCRPLLVAADLGRAAALLTVPVAVVFDALTLTQLYGVLFVVGALTTVFDIGHQAYLPRLVADEDLVEGNARLATNASVAAVAGAGLGGALVQWLGATLVLLLDSLSYLWSALWLRGIRATEERPAREQGGSLRTEIAAGVRFVWRHRILRPIAASSVGFVLFQSAADAIMVVFLFRDLGLTAAVIGLLGMLGLSGAVASSFVTGWIGRRVGTARAMLAGAVLAGVGFLLFPLTTPGVGLACYLAGGVLSAFGIILVRIMQATAYQQLSPPELRGRVAATIGVATRAVTPVGAVLGGVLAGIVGVRGTLWLAGAMVLASSVWLFASPLRRLRDLPLHPA